MTTALIIIEIQNNYFNNGSNKITGSLLAAKNSRLILDNFRFKGLPIIHVQHLATRSTATFFLPGTIDADNFVDVRTFDDEKSIIKYYSNGFR